MWNLHVGDMVCQRDYVKAVKSQLNFSLRKTGKTPDTQKGNLLAVETNGWFCSEYDGVYCGADGYRDCRASRTAREH